MNNQNTSSPQADWIPRIESALAALEEKPQFGAYEEFQLEEFQEELRKLFKKPSLTIQYLGKGWHSKDKIEALLGGDHYIQEIFLNSIAHPFYWVIDQGSFRALMTDFLGGKEASSPFLKDEHVQDFYYFLCAEVSFHLASLPFFEDLPPRLGERYAHWPDVNASSSAFVFDLSLQVEKQKYHSHLIVPEFFRDEWKSAVGRRGPLKLSLNQLKKIPVELSLEVGSLQLAPLEFKKVKKGDVILMDRCSYDPEKKKGRFVLTLQNIPLFRAKIENRGLKLLDYPLYEHVETPMDFEKNEEKELFGDIENEEEIFHEDILTEKTEEKSSNVSIEEVPLQMTVEVGRLRMTAQELLQLSPGSLVELNIRPEQGVSLVLHGKAIARGELVKLGEVLGVRILEI